MRQNVYIPCLLSSLLTESPAPVSFISVVLRNLSAMSITSDSIYCGCDPRPIDYCNSALAVDTGLPPSQSLY